MAPGAEGRAIDEKGAGGEIGGTGEAVGDGEDEGALECLLGRLGAAAREFLMEGDAEAGGEAAEGVGDAGRERGDVIEGEDPVAAGEADEIADGGGRGGEGAVAGSTMMRRCGRREICRCREGPGG